jgi:ribosomal protein S18 acetylase RimI-like enzyme
VQVQEAIAIAELDRFGFLAAIDDFLAIYAAAMAADPAELPSRRAIMERHSGSPDFRALAVHAASSGRVVAFTYGFRGLPGQWWHDVVRAGMVASAGPRAAGFWLDDVLEIAEVHVHPDYQARGIGRRMMRTLTDRRSERTAVLSTRDAPTPARRLYRSLGFADLLSDFLFPGGGPPYAVMGAALPLLGQSPATGEAGS